MALLLIVLLALFLAKCVLLGFLFSLVFDGFGRAPEEPFRIGEIWDGSAYFDWYRNGTGFGQLSFSVDPTTKRITCENECMSRKSVRKILHAFADEVADRAVLLDE